MRFERKITSIIQKILGLFFLGIAIAVAQPPHRHPNPGFRNTRTPLASSASRDRPYLSIPIVLMPDGQIIPKPAQASYHYVGNAPKQSHQRNSKPRGTVTTGETEETYQIVVPPPPSFIQEQRQMKMHKNGRNAGKEQRGSSQTSQQNQPPKYFHQNDRTQTVSVMQLPNQRNQQTNEAHKQNVANFLTFATQLGADVLSQQRGGQKSNQAMSTNVQYRQPEVQNVQETYVMQVPPTQDGRTYTQTQMQHISVSQMPHHAPKNNNPVQQTNYNGPQIQYQSTPASTTVQYVQTSNIRQPNQGIVQQTGVQNQPTMLQQNVGGTVHFPGNQNSNPVATNSYNQSPPQVGNQNYQFVNQQSNVQLVPAKNYETQTQTIYVPQPVVEATGHDGNRQPIQQNYGIQSSQTYVTADGQQITFANVADASPVTYRNQQNGHQNNPNSQQATITNVQSNFGQSGNQNIYVSHQNSQDLTTLPQYASPVQNGQQIITPQQAANHPYQGMSNNQNVYENQNGQTAYRNQPQAPQGQSEQTAYSYANTQPNYVSSPQSNQDRYANAAPVAVNYQESQYEYSTQSSRNEKKMPEQESTHSTGAGQLIYASSSAKQINYTPSVQDSTQVKANTDQSYVSFPNSGSSSTSSTDASGSAYAKQSTSGQSNDEQQSSTQDSENDGEEETSYKVVYIPLDILKNILSNSVENQN
ncbi:uncharacterized protein TNCV_1830421 [Trichonephila clavipes]|nr:uncharacterized protein TNCV_1830421 [Trichonephila clavipes]